MAPATCRRLPRSVSPPNGSRIDRDCPTRRGARSERGFPGAPDRPSPRPRSRRRNSPVVWVSRDKVGRYGSLGSEDARGLRAVSPVADVAQFSGDRARERPGGGDGSRERQDAAAYTRGSGIGSPSSRAASTQLSISSSPWRTASSCVRPYVWQPGSSGAKACPTQVRRELPDLPRHRRFGSFRRPSPMGTA